MNGGEENIRITKSNHNLPIEEIIVELINGCNYVVTKFVCDLVENSIAMIYKDRLCSPGS